MKWFSKKSKISPSSITTPATKPSNEPDLSCITSLAKGDDSRSYLYRTESSKGWQRFFTSDFEVTVRPNNSQDMAMNPELRKAAAAFGEARGFYYYADREYVSRKVADYHDDAVSEDGWILNHARDRSLCLVARYDTSCPALKGRSHFKDGTQNADSCRYLIADVDNYIIPRDYMEIYLYGAWRKLPAKDDTTIVDLLVHLEQQGAMCRTSTTLLMNILRFK